MAANQTPNYGLCQWEPGDQVLRTDFNEDNAKLDQALQALEDRTHSLEYEAKFMGHCSVYYLTYVGDGHPNRTFAFNHRPELVFLAAVDGSVPPIYGVRGTPIGSDQETTFTWTNANVGLVGTRDIKANVKGEKYVAVAIVNNIF